MNTFAKLSPSQIHNRWMIRRDMAEVLAIEDASYPNPWSEHDFIRCLRDRNVIGMVAEVDERVRGFMLYEIFRDKLQVLNFAVQPEFRRRGVGSAMVRKLVSKLSPQWRNRIMMEIRESNLTAQLFFRSQGFQAVSTLRDFYDDTNEDAYLMQYKVKQEAIA